MISFCLPIFPCGHIDGGVCEYVADTQTCMRECAVIGYLKAGLVMKPIHVF